MGLKIRIDPYAYITAAMILLLLPARVWMAVLFAASIHELAHLAALCMLGERIAQLDINPLGAKIVAMPMSRGREVLCALAGPLGSFSLLSIGDQFPVAALFGLVQGAYNLLPAYPLDGGRIMRGLFSNAVCAAAESFTIVMLWGLGIWFAIGYNLGIFPIFPALAVTIEVLKRKYPCKEQKFAVQ